MVNLRTVGLLVLLLCASLTVAGKPNWAKPGVAFMYAAAFAGYYEEKDFNVLMQKVNATVNRILTGDVPVPQMAFVFRLVLVSANDTHGVFQIELGAQRLEGQIEISPQRSEGYITWSDGVFRVNGKEFFSIFRPLEKLRGLPQTTVFGLPVYEVVERNVKDSVNTTWYFYYHKDTGVLVLAINVDIYRSSDKELRWDSYVGYIMLRGGSVVRGKPQWAAPGVKLVYRTYELSATDIEEALQRAEEVFARGVAAGKELVYEFVAVDDLHAIVRYSYAETRYEMQHLFWITGGELYKPPEVLQGHPLVRLGPYETYKVAIKRYGTVAYYQKDTGILLMSVTPEAKGRFRIFALASTNISIPTTGGEGGGATPSPAAGGTGGLWLVIAVAVAVAVVAVVLLRKRR
jgi:hypothetical protein